jgi:hypothetical protein
VNLKNKERYIFETFPRGGTRLLIGFEREELIGHSALEHSTPIDNVAALDNR